jgi:hypothetical protein
MIKRARLRRKNPIEISPLQKEKVVEEPGGCSLDSSRAILRRRQFLKLCAAGGGALIVNSCAGNRALPATPAASPTSGLAGVEGIFPIETSLWDLADAYTEKTSTRPRICLHGMWRVQPAMEEGAAPPSPGQIYYSQVPGRWNSANHYQTFREQGGRLVPVEKVDGSEVYKYFNGWYTRYIPLPPGSPGRRILLTLDYLGANTARFFVNGQLQKTVTSGNQNSFGLMRTVTMDLTAFASRETLKLDVFLHLDPYPAPWDIEGLSLDYFFLHVVDSPLAVKDILVLPSVRDGNVVLDVDFYNLERAQDSGYGWQARIFHANNDALALESGVVALPLNGGETENASLLLDWKDPVCWDLENPRLYYAKIYLYRDGRLVDESLPQSFGFRELWEQDGDFYLNGNPIHLRTRASSMIQRYHMLYCREETIAEYLQAEKREGFNAELAEVCYNATWGDSWQGFSPTYIKTVLNASDRLGYLWFVWAPPLLEGYDEELHREELRVHVRRWGNHPSMAMHLGSFNQAGYPWAQHPLMVNDLTYEPELFHDSRELVRKTEAALRELDPSRLVYHNYSGNLNRIFTTMHYMSFGIPLQEQEDWPETWSKSRKTALFPSEFGIPYSMQFYDFDKAGDEGASLIVEHAARYFGDAVYADVTKPAPRHPGFLLRQATDVVEGSELDPALEATVRLFARNILRAWRGYGLSGFGVFDAENYTYDRQYEFFQIPGIRYDSIKTPGLKPNVVSVPGRLFDIEKPNALAHAVSEVLSPVAAWIAGGEPDFTNKDHGYFSGERIRKQIFLIHERPVSSYYQYSIVLESEHGVQDKLTGDGTVAPGEMLFLPVAFTAPDVEIRKEFTLTLEVTLESGRIGDTFPVQVFPRSSYTPPDILFGLLDSNGRTRTLLDQEGVSYREVSSADQMAEVGALIIGRESWSEGTEALLRSLRESGRTDSGLPVLVLEQAGATLGQLILEQVSERCVFIQDRNHPLVAGLEAEDFSNWRGAGDFFEVPTPVDPGTEYSEHYPHYKFRVSNRGIVATNVLRKTAFGGLHPVLGCGFDMMNTPLAETTLSNSTVVFCQADVTNRCGIDPAATQLFRNLLNYLAACAKRVPSPSRTLALADEHFRAVLETCRIDAEYAEEVPAGWKTCDILLLANSAILGDLAAEDLAAFVRGGGRVILCSGEDPAVPDVPFALRATPASHFHLTVSDQHPLMAGLGNSDFYFREAKPVTEFQLEDSERILSEPVIAVRNDGRGQWIFIGLDPARFHADLSDEERSFIDSYVEQKAYRILNVVLHNAGVRHLPFAPWESGDAVPSPYLADLPDYDVNAFHNW